MDLETENRIAAILMKEAAELRRQAEKEVVHVYLRQPKSRVRPNTRFLTATVHVVQQSNRAVETYEMWRIRQKELELNYRLKHKSKDRRNIGSSYRGGNSLESTSKRAKRGRGAVGSRMDETGPYLPRCLDSKEDSRSSDVAECHVYGPEKPSFLKLGESFEEESDVERRKKQRKKDYLRSSKQQHSEKRRLKKKSKDKKRKRKDERRSKHNH